MIIHKLITQHLKGGDNADFYLLQARDAIAWMKRSGAPVGEKTRALDLGCGHGIFGAELIRQGCQVTFADEENFLPAELRDVPFRRVNLDRDSLDDLGQYDLVICSNVLEHLANPRRLVEGIRKLVALDGHFYLSWTNWLSPWGGHEFSPFHYLGARRGHLIYDRLIGRPRKHTPFQNLFPTYIGPLLKMIQAQPGLKIVKTAPRYYPEFSFVARVPFFRELLTWNCAVLLQRVSLAGILGFLAAFW